MTGVGIVSGVFPTVHEPHPSALHSISETIKETELTEGIDYLHFKADTKEIWFDEIGSVRSV